VAEEAAEETGSFASEAVDTVTETAGDAYDAVADVLTGETENGAN